MSFFDKFTKPKAKTQDAPAEDVANEEYEIEPLTLRKVPQTVELMSRRREEILRKRYDAKKEKEAEFITDSSGEDQ